VQGRLLAHQLFHGIDGIEAALPEVLVVPGILTDGDGEAHTVEFDHPLRFGRQEVALLVKDVVEGQKPLVLFDGQLALVEEDGGVEGWLPAISAGRQRHAGQNGRGKIARGRGEFVDGRAATGQEAGLLEEIGGRVTADGKLGKDGEARATIRRAAIFSRFPVKSPTVGSIWARAIFTLPV
jgi:hypothetical protein